MRIPTRYWRWLLILTLSMAVAGCSTIGGWFDSDEDDDPTQPVELMDIEEKVNIRKLWSTSVGDGQGEGYYEIQPTIAGDYIYVASSDGEVKAVNRHSGKVLWTSELEDSLSGGVAVYENALLLGSSDGIVFQLSASDGAVQWSTRLHGEVLAPPQANGNVVIAQTYDGKLQGLNFDTGELLWVYDSDVPILTVRGTSTPIIRDNQVYAGFATGRVLAFNANTGAIAWEVRVAISQGRSEIERIVDIDGTMELLGNELYAASYQGRIVAIDINNGRKLWQQEISSFSGVSQGFGNIYVTDEDGTVNAYLRNGQGIRWQQDALGYRGLSRPSPVSSYVAVADFEGIVHLMSQVDGQFVGRVKVDGDGARADMLSDGNLLYVYGNSGTLIAYEISSRE
ncbi:MAG: outer membrane protein assembly factor BamB [Halieaceae bacterium]|jgi:outer membrane protein assembly factor BamB|nr:outer membrane protein assembly factor BamB [Halieaceae bacterium]